MSTRVNLLQAEELRQHATVSRESLIRLGVIGAVVLAVAWVGWSVWQFYGVSHRHGIASQQWAAIREDYESAKVLQTDLNGNRSILDELAGWTRSRVVWDASFDELREIVPENMQLTRLSVQGEIQVPSLSGKERADKADLVRRYGLHLEGIAQGALSDQDVIRFVDNLRVGSSFSPWLASVKLQGLQRQGKAARSLDDAAQEIRTFRVDATSKERPFR